MPAILERCVEQVMAKGHDQSSAWAICRTSLGLASDGSDDGKAEEIPEVEMNEKVNVHLAKLALQDQDVLIKRMVVAKPIGKFANGPEQAGVLSRERLAKLVKNQQDYPRQIPIFIASDHPERNDEMAPAGWVEGLALDDEGNLMADPAKLLGAGAYAVSHDLIRGASIYTVQARDYEGNPIGEVLKHVLLTNEGFIRDLNVAAARSRGDERPVIYFTALKGKTHMANKTKTVPARAEIEDPKALELIDQQESEIVRLKAENLGLREQMENTKVDDEKDNLRLRVASLERKTEAQEIRELVLTGLKRGTLKGAWVNGYNEKGDEGTLSWFKASRFEGDKKLLKYQVEQSDPVVKLGQSFATGAPNEKSEAALSAEDKDWLRSRGIDPDKVAIAGKARDLGEYRRLKAQKGQGVN